MCILDETVLNSMAVNEIFYGFKCKLDPGHSFSLEGYICFMEAKSVREMRLLVPFFTFVKKFCYTQRGVIVQDHLCHVSIFTKWGMGGTTDNLIINLEVAWHYAELHCKVIINQNEDETKNVQ